MITKSNCASSTSKLSLVYGQCWQFARLINVEPALFFFSGGWDVYNVMFTTGLYWKICEQKFGDDNSVDCHSRKHAPEVESYIQKTTAQWKMYIVLALVVPLIIIGPLYGAYGDRHGRKINMILGMVGIIFTSLIALAQFTFVHMPLYASVIVASLTALTGSFGNIMTSMFAYVADCTKDKDLMTIRFSVLQVIHNLASILFGFILGGMMHSLTFSHGLLLVLVLHVVSFFWVIVFLKQEPPMKKLEKSIASISKIDNLKHSHKTKHLHRLMVLPRDKVAMAVAAPFDVDFQATELPKPLRKSSTSEIKEDPFTQQLQSPVKKVKSKKTGIHLLTHTIKKLVLHSFHTAMKPRNGNLRACIWVTTLAFFVLCMSNSGLMMILNLYCLHSPLNWSTSDIANYTGFNACVQLVGTLAGTLGLKRLRFHETSILMISMCSAIAKCVMIGLSYNKTMMYIAAALGVLSNLMFPLCKSLICQFVERNEIGKIYSLFHIATDFALILAYSGMTSLYAATVHMYPGLVFQVTGGLLIIAFLAIVWVHFDFRRYRALNKSDSSVKLTATNSF